MVTSEKEALRDKGCVEGEGGIDLDAVLEHEAGGLGRFQVRNAAPAFMSVLFLGLASSEFLFTTGRISTRCLVPECESAGSAAMAPPWLSLAVPATGAGLDSCHRFASNTTTDNTTCTVDTFNRSAVVPCGRYVYENTDTIVHEFDLACDEWRRTLVGSVRTLGTLVNQPVTGYASDRWGRRAALVVNSFNLAWIGLARYFATDFVGFLFCEFTETFLGAGVYACVYILMMETTTPKHRVLVSVLMSNTFSMAHAILGVVAWALPNWRHLTLALYAPQILSIMNLWLVTESARWYMSKGYHKKAEEVLKKCAEVNKRQLSEKTLDALRLSAKREMNSKVSEKKKADPEPWLVVLVWRHKPVLLRCLLAPVWWITMTVVYYGLSVNAVTLTSGNKHANFVLASLIEVPGYWVTYLLLNRVGRKPVIIAAYWTCAVCQLAYMLVPAGYPTAGLSLYMLGKCSISMAVTSLYVYTAELFPTRHRHSLFAFCSMMGRVGAIVAPLTPAFGGNIPFVLFGVMAALSGLLVMVTPETLHCKLPDTMEEAARLVPASRRSERPTEPAEELICKLHETVEKDASLTQASRRSHKTTECPEELVCKLADTMEEKKLARDKADSC